jgi:AcrR family transcriptional regulator
VSAEQRRAERRARMVDAGLDVLGAEGIANMTMTAVCTRAGLTERYFYESFRNLDELLVELFDALARELAETIVQALESSPPDLLARCRAAGAALMTVLVEDQRKARIFAESIGSAALRERRDRAVRDFALLLADQMRRLSGVTAEHQQPHLELVTTMLVGGLAEAVAAWINGALSVTREDLIEDGARLAVAAAVMVRGRWRDPSQPVVHQQRAVEPHDGGAQRRLAGRVEGTCDRPDGP